MSDRPSRKRSKITKPPASGVSRRRLREVSDAEIARTSPAELANLPADFWDAAVLKLPVPKQAISLRVDEDVLAWFRGLGPRYQTRMNAVLRAFMESAPSARRLTKTPVR